MYEHPRGGKNNFGDAKNGPPDSYMYFMNQIKVTVFNISDIPLLFKIRILLVKNFLNLFFDLSHIFQISSYHDMIQTIFTQKKYYCMLLL